MVRRRRPRDQRHVAGQPCAQRPCDHVHGRVVPTRARRTPADAVEPRRAACANRLPHPSPQCSGDQRRGARVAEPIFARVKRVDHGGELSKGARLVIELGRHRRERQIERSERRNVLAAEATRNSARKLDRSARRAPSASDREPGPGSSGRRTRSPAGDPSASPGRQGFQDGVGNSAASNAAVRSPQPAPREDRALERSGISR